MFTYSDLTDSITLLKIIALNSVLGFLHSVVVGDVADVSELHCAPISMVILPRLGQKDQWADPLKGPEMHQNSAV
jgi:hypothetical protein